MDIEFHYYTTYLVAARAGYPPEEAATIAHACQMVDDNTKVFEVRMGGRERYRNMISQTMNILRPREEYTAVYQTFHFLPGEPDAPSAARADGRRHKRVTTPDSPNAQAMLHGALATGDPFRIGIACHTYADTWAHQNFVGTWDDFNALPGAGAIPDIGHADAGHKPDEAATVWQDHRLAPASQTVKNRARFLDAASMLFGRLRLPRTPAISPEVMAKQGRQLIADLDTAIGPTTRGGRGAKGRLGRLEALAITPPYGGEEIPAYDYTAWPNAAFTVLVEPWNDLPAASGYRPGAGLWNWQDPKRYETTAWHRFQEAVRAHHRETLALIG